MHVHLSGIEYGPKGEKKHLTMVEIDFLYKDCLAALKTYNAGGYIICESPILELDGILLKDYYGSL